MQILTVRHRVLSYLLWYSTMVSVGRSVRSYVCADLHAKAALQKGLAFAPSLPPWIRHCTVHVSVGVHGSNVVAHVGRPSLERQSP